MARIPLRARDGSVRGWVLVDDADLTWLNQWRWSLSDGYAVRGAREGGRIRRFYMHRQILGLEHGDRRQGEHENRNRLDCRRSNLLIATRGCADNSQNKSGLRNNTSGYRGVTWDKRKRKWVAQAVLAGRHLYLGAHATPELADAAVRTWRAKHMPFSEDARLAA